MPPVYLLVGPVAAATDVPGRRLSLPVPPADTLRGQEDAAVAARAAVLETLRGARGHGDVVVRVGLRSTAGSTLVVLECVREALGPGVRVGVDVIWEDGGAPEDAHLLGRALWEYLLDGRLDRVEAGRALRGSGTAPAGPFGSRLYGE